FAGTANGISVTFGNSTISGNTAGAQGGGIATASSFGTLTVQNSTITGNSAVTGGGVARSLGTGAFAIESTIVSGNSAAVAPDISSAGTVSVNHSAIGSGTGFVPSGSNNLPYGTDLKLRPLAENGGLTRTHALLVGSPAINAGSNPVILSNDQRGSGFARLVGPAPDIGAFEVQPPPRVASVVINGGA